MTIAKRHLDELEERRKQLALAGGGDKLEKRRGKGLMTARERLEGLFQRNTLQEINTHARHECVNFDLAGKELPGDGVIAATGYVDGRPVTAISQDFTVMAGTLGRCHADKILTAMDFAHATGTPLVAFKDSGGARIQEGVDALSGYGKVFYKNVLLSGLVPQIAIICGPCAGGAAYSPALMDFVIMTRDNAHMFITGPQVIKAVTGRETSMDEIGSPDIHASISGNAHFVADNDTQALALAKKLLGFLPLNNTEDPPHRLPPDLDLEPDPGLDDLVPEDSSAPLDSRAVIRRIVDDGDFLEVHEFFARNLIVGFARIGGVVVGMLANQPMEKAGALDIDASDKGARFIRFCNVFNVPLVTLVDVPGFLPGIEQERGGIIRHGAKMLFAYGAATVPKLTVVMRKAYGGSYLAMCSREMGADLVYAWPCAEIAVMGAEGAVNVLYRNELKGAEDPKAKRGELADEYRRAFASPYMSAGRGYITDVIAPSETRGTLILSLRKLLTKRQERPPKKHGNNPL